jgi:RNA 3'-terminal phosphate cyclase (ATP)
MIAIDASRGEGGGQVLRTALALAAAAGRSVRLHGIRAGRRNAGLAPQHLAAVLAAAEICGAEVRGATLGSTEISFVPGVPVRGGERRWDVSRLAGRGSAGAATLILQTLLAPLALAATASRLVIGGGTHVPWSPPFEYLRRVFLPAVDPCGLHAELQLQSWGFYPAGGGCVIARVPPVRASSLKPLILEERGGLRRVAGVALTSGLPDHVARRLAATAVERLAPIIAAEPGRPGLRVDERRVGSAGPGAVLMLAAEYEHLGAGFTAWGKRGKPAERVADAACEAFLAHHASGAAADPHLADQLVLPLALARGTSRVHTSRVSRHLLTVAELVPQLAPARVDVVGDLGRPGLVVIEGAGLAVAATDRDS